MDTKKRIGNAVLFLAAAVLLAAGIGITARNYAYAKNIEAVSQKVLRFHVIAESDSEDDQRRKLLVRDAVGQWLSSRLSGIDSRADCEELIRTHEAQLVALAEQTLADDGRAQQVTLRLADVEFPDRVYGDYEFPAGTYRALELIIGEGQGHNWWCVLYPNLCFSGEAYDVTGEQAKEELAQTLSASEYESLLKKHKYKLGFRYFR